MNKEETVKAVYDQDEHFMRFAIEAARMAYERGDVPVGAMIVYDQKIIASSGNTRHTSPDPTAHAEIVVMRKAAEIIGNWRLDGCTLYVTLEPCAMCAGACVNARLPRLVYGADDPKAGAVKSLYEITTDPRLNHRVSVTDGVLADECSALLTNFFSKKRK